MYKHYTTSVLLCTISMHLCTINIIVHLRRRVHGGGRLVQHREEACTYVNQINKRSLYIHTCVYI